MYSGRRKAYGNNSEFVEEIDLNETKFDCSKSAISSHYEERPLAQSMIIGNCSLASGSFEDTIDDKPALQRGLKARHVSAKEKEICQMMCDTNLVIKLTMISLGGTIGTGLFLASGSSVAEAGPGGALIAYTLIGTMVFFVMECLGEMVYLYPTLDLNKHN
jgi:lysine-specific permease